MSACEYLDNIYIFRPFYDIVGFSSISEKPSASSDLSRRKIYEVSR